MKEKAILIIGGTILVLAIAGIALDRHTQEQIDLRSSGYKVVPIQLENGKNLSPETVYAVSPMAAKIIARNSISIAIALGTGITAIAGIILTNKTNKS